MTGEISQTSLAEFELVPKYLTPDKNLLDQPPFYWLFVGNDIFPDDFFKNPAEGEPSFVKFLLGNYRFSTKELFGPKRYPVRNFLEQVNPRYRDVEQLLLVCRATHAFLERYPHCIKYLMCYWQRGQQIFDSLGRNHTPLRIPTYASWRDRLRRLEENSKYVGLAEILPEASAAEDIQLSIPGRSSVNRVFRLYRSGALE